MTVGELVTQLSQIKAERTALTQQDNELKAQQNDIEAQLMAKLGELGADTTTVRGVGTVSLNKEIVPTITDWDAFNASVREQDLLFLFQRRLNASAYRSLLDQGVVIDGVNPTEITKLAFRKN